MPIDINAAVDTWFNTYLRNGAIARDTEAYNQVFAALPALKSALTPPSEPAPQTQE